MKTLYTSPVITVEELIKLDVLCASTEKTEGSFDESTQRDNLNQLGSTLGDLSSLL